MEHQTIFELYWLIFYFTGCLSGFAVILPFALSMVA